MNNITNTARIPIRYFQRASSQHSLDRKNTFSQRLQNFYSTSPPLTSGRKLFVISGSGATTARSLILKALAIGDVIGLSSKCLKEFEVPGLKFVQLSSEDLKNPTSVAEKVQARITEEGEIHYEKISALNLIGGALAPKDSSLEILNQHIPSRFFRGIHMLAKKMDSTLAMGGISSIAATVSSDECDYARAKREADIAFCKLGKEFGANTIILRPGIILEKHTLSEIYDRSHDYSPEQFSKQFFHLLVGSGLQLQQPVTKDCLFEALLNGLEVHGQRIVNAVNDKTLTMQELFMFFSKRKNVLSVHVPYPIAEKAVEIAPRGRFQKYSIRMLKELEQPEKNVPICSKEFRNLLQKKRTLSLEEYYPPCDTFVTTSPPYLKHVSQFFKSVFKG